MSRSREVLEDCQCSMPLQDVTLYHLLMEDKQDCPGNMDDF